MALNFYRSNGGIAGYIPQQGDPQGNQSGSVGFDRGLPIYSANGLSLYNDAGGSDGPSAFQRNYGSQGGGSPYLGMSGPGAYLGPTFQGNQDWRTGTSSWESSVVDPHRYGPGSPPGPSVPLTESELEYRILLEGGDGGFNRGGLVKKKPVAPKIVPSYAMGGLVSTRPEEDNQNPNSIKRNDLRAYISGNQSAFHDAQGYAIGGLIDQISANSPEAASSAEDQLIMSALAAIDPNSPMTEQQRIQVLEAFEAEYGPGSIEELKEMYADRDPTEDNMIAKVMPNETIIPTAPTIMAGGGDPVMGSQRIMQVANELAQANGGDAAMPMAPQGIAALG